MEIEIPQQILEAAKSRFLLFCVDCHGAFTMQRGAYGLPYNGIQHFVCDNCLEYLNKGRF